MSNYKVQLSVDVSDQFLYDILTTAAEGGIGYWADYRTVRDEALDVREIHDIQDTEDGDPFEKGFLNIADIVLGLNKICAGETSLHHKAASFILRCVQNPDGGETLDADDCDSIVQVALFGDLVYG